MIGLIGLGVMGRNLALNLIDHGFPVAGYDQNAEARARSELGGIAVVESIPALLAHLPRPRSVLLMVPAGSAVDGVLDALCPMLHAGDTVIDGGNSHYRDTTRRAERLAAGGLQYLGLGISGGEAGARHGPAIMAGGARAAYDALEPLLQAVAAKVGDMPCVAYMGPDGAGHFVKTLHNGIEYADMQLIAEAYSLLRISTALSPAELAEVFAEWNRRELASYLIEITADILKQDDPITGKPLVDVILDRAGMKGTGTWTAVNALELGVPAISIAEAVFARGMSGLKDERTAASRVLAGPHSQPLESKDAFIEAVRDALYCSKICAYAQGFGLMRAAQDEYDWELDFGEVARIWRGGCIIRAAFLQKITEAYRREPSLANLLLDGYFSEAIAERQAAWREVVSQGALRGIPTPAFSSALAYYDSYRSETLPANLLQAQRDYFGAHTFERLDQPAGRHFHLDWTDPKRPQVKA